MSIQNSKCKITVSWHFFLSCIHPRSIVKAIKTFRRDGIVGVLQKIRLRRHSFHAERVFAYRNFLKATRPTKEELENQAKLAENFTNKPVFGIIIPLFNTKTEYIKDLFESFLSQTYPHFKVFLIDASSHISGSETTITDDVKNFSQNDERFIYRILDKNRTIPENTNYGIQLAMDDPTITHICLCDHDDILWPNTLFEYAEAIEEHPKAQILYCDEDMATGFNDNEAYYVAKPDFSEFYLESCNYINHFFVCSKDLMNKIKTSDGSYERAAYNGAQDYDLYLRLVTEALKVDKKVPDCLYTSDVIYHIPKFLYRWRAAEGSTAQNSKNKMYAFESGKRALEAYYKTRKIPFKKVEITDTLGTYKTEFLLREKPLVSVIIPNKDHIEDLSRAIETLRSGTYHNLEFIIIENNSEQPETFGYYKKISKSKNVKVINYGGEFNYSDINNFGAKHAKGEVLLFANNDIEMIASNSIAEMLTLLERQNVGIVGAELLYPDNTIQHAGVVVGMTNSANHIFNHIAPDSTYVNRGQCVCDYSAVTGACLMIKKTTFLSVDGFDDKLAVALNDIDLCLKVREIGARVVYTPYASFYHHESKTRGLDEKDPEKLARFESEAKYFRRKWHKIFETGDPYYNPNLSLEDFNCELRRIPRKPAKK